jgi:hypothetical protein
VAVIVAGVAVVWCYGGGHPSYLVLSWFPFPFCTREEEKSARDASDASPASVIVVVAAAVVIVEPVVVAVGVAAVIVEPVALWSVWWLVLSHR